MTRSTLTLPLSTPYRRRATPLSHPRTGAGPDRFDETVAELRRHGVRGDIAVPAAPAERGPRLARLGARAVSVVAAVLAATLGVGIFSTAAYFTDAKAVNATVVVGDVDLAIRNVDGSTVATTPLTLKGLTPLTTAAATNTTRGAIISFKLKPATLDTRAVITAQGVDAGTTANLMQYVRVALSVDDGATWTSAAPLTTTAVRSPELTVPKQPSTSSVLSGTVKARFFLTADTPTSLQGAALQIKLGVQSIQRIAPAGSTY